MHQHTYRRKASILAGSILSVSALMLGNHAQAQSFQGFVPGNLVISTSTYVETGDAANLVAGSSSLPDSADGVTPFTATATGAYPYVFNNEQVDANFGVTSAISLNQLSLNATTLATPSISATPNGTLAIPASVAVTSFPSKSEVALNLSTDGKSLTFMGYQAPVGALDVSNMNTPGITEPGNYVTGSAYREVVQVDPLGNIQATTTNAYAGNNGRAAIYDATNNQYITVGNAGAGNGSAQITAAAGVQTVTPGVNATSSTPGTNMLASFNVNQINPATGQPYATGTAATKDKTSKDNNYRGLTVFNNTVFVTKGSGSNGINTVYQVGTTGSLATGTGNTMNVLPGFPTVLARNISTTTPALALQTNYHPFGLWFANATTLYVADEGDGTQADAGTNLDPNAGLEKWTFNGTQWVLAYTLQAGLHLGQTYSVANGPNGEVYPTGTNSATGADWAPATDGIRNITGRVNADGSVTIFGVTSTVSGATDQGADPNEIVAITDDVNATSLPSTENFTTLESAQYGEVYRGVSFAPTPEPTSAAMLGLGLLSLGGVRRRKRS